MHVYRTRCISNGVCVRLDVYRQSEIYVARGERRGEISSVRFDPAFAYSCVAGAMRMETLYCTTEKEREAENGERMWVGQ